MVRKYWNKIYIDKDPNDLYKGWAWIEITTEDCKKFGIPTGDPETYKRVCRSPGERLKLPNDGNLPTRGKTAGKKFLLNMDGEIITVRAHKSLTIEAISAWVKSWANPNTKIITPGNRTLSIDGDKLVHQTYFVYFILNKDSDAIKIGHAKDLNKRMRTLQTASPAQLSLIKTILVKDLKEAQALEKSLHQKFHPIRLAGEWFKADPSLLDYINQL